MPNMSHEVIANSTARAQTQILELINNLLAAWEEITRVKINEEIRQLFEKMSLEQIPWNEQMMKLMVHINQHPDLSDEQKSAINAIILTEYQKEQSQNLKGISQTNQEGYEDLRKTIKRSRLPKEDKKIVEKIINRAIYEMNDPHHITVDRGGYRAMVKYLNQTSLMSQVTAIQTVSGNYMLLYSAAIEPQIQKIASMISLQEGIIPRPEVEDIMQHVQAAPNKDKNERGQVIKFTGLSPELAEKAVVESTKSRGFSFAKQLREDGKYDLYCYGGVTAEDKIEKYKEAVQTIALAAYSMTGPTGDIERKKAAHSAHEYEKITKVLSAIQNETPDEEDNGYVYSIQTITDNNNNRYILTDNYVQFGPEEFTIYANGNRHLVQAEDCQDYVQTLKLNLQSGAGQKVYISEKRMNELSEQSARVEKLIEGLKGQNPMERVDELIQMRIEAEDRLSQAVTDLEKQGIREELEDINIAFDAVNLHMRDGLTTDKILSRAIANELHKAEFRGYASKDVTKEMINNAALCNKAMISHLKNSNVIEGLNPDTPSISDVFNVLSQAEFSTYINKEMAEIDTLKTPEEQEDQMRVLQQKVDTLSLDFMPRAQEAQALLQQIGLEIEKVGPEEQIDTRNTRNLHTMIRKTAQELLGIEIEIEKEKTHSNSRDRIRQNEQTL